MLIALGIFAYLLLIPGMYVVGCCLDRIFGFDGDDSNLSSEWGIAVFWPMLVVFIVFALAVTITVAPFCAACEGRDYLRRAVMEDNNSDGPATKDRISL